MSAESADNLAKAVLDAALQWGRAHVSAESVANSAGNFDMEVLQWGRAHVSAESKKYLKFRVDYRPCFNGAALT